MGSKEDLEKKVKKLEHTVKTLEAKIEELDMSYALLLRIIEKEVTSGSLKLDMCCFEN